MSDLISRQDATRWVKTECNPYGKPTLDFKRRVFNGIVVEYPSINTYPEYEGKPYFQIKYTENGREFIGYGTYKPEVLSEFLKEYFMPSAEPKTGKWETDMVYAGIEFYRCDQCDFRQSEKSRYCPNCGARMYKDGEDE